MTARAPEILNGMDEIGTKFGVSAKTIRKWCKAGAPITRDSRNHVSAEAWELWDWRKEQNPVKIPQA